MIISQNGKPAEVLLSPKDYDELVNTKWYNFKNIIEKAKISCEKSGILVSDHFADVGKMIEIGKWGQREIDDIALTRYACFFIGQNGDPPKERWPLLWSN